MKQIFILFFIFLSTFSFAQTQTDNIVTETAKYINNKQWAAAKNLLKNGEQTDYRIIYLSTVVDYKILEENGTKDFESVNGVRTNAKNYLNKYPSRNGGFTANIKDIIVGLDKMNPIQTREENERAIKKAEEERVAKELERKIAELNELLADEYYSVVASRLNGNTDFKPYVKGYFTVMSNYGILRNNNDFMLQDVLNVKKELNGYLERYRAENYQFTEKVRTALSDLNTNYPSTQEEFLAKKEAIRRANLEAAAQNKIEQLRNFFQEKKYDYVIANSAGFPSDTKFTEEARYLETLSQYYNFLKINHPDFDQITSIRAALSAYAKNNQNKNASYIAEIDQKSAFVNNNFPKTKQEYDAKLIAERKAEEKRYAEEQAKLKAAARTARIAKKYEDGFFAIGYEGGTIAKYGLRMELGSRKILGFFLNVRTSLTSDSDLSNDSNVANKNEVVAGPNFRVAKWLFLNIGAGYGYHKRFVRNDYLQQSELETKTYVAGYSGATFRITPLINLVGGVSFIDIDKEFYTPEFTFGLTINLK